jgi:hypothetical protein
MKLSVKVVPKSSRDAVIGWQGDGLKVCVRATPERGKANAAVEEVLARALGVGKGSVRVVVGHSSPRKIVEIQGLEVAEVKERLSAHKNK